MKLAAGHSLGSFARLPPRRWLRFRLVTLLALVTLVAAGFMGWRWWHRDEYARRRIEALGGSVQWIDEFPVMPAPKPSPEWHHNAVEITKGWRGGNEGLRPLRDLYRLRELNLYADQARLTDACLQFIARSVELERVYISRMRIGPDGADQIAALPKLEVLVLPYCHFHGGSLTRLSHLPELVSLSLPRASFAPDELKNLGPKLEWLNFLEASVTDMGLTHLKSLSNLEYLNLTGTQITDATLLELVDLPSLRELYTYRTGVTDQGIARFHELRGNRPAVAINVETDPFADEPGETDAFDDEPAEGDVFDEPAAAGQRP